MTTQKYSDAELRREINLLLEVLEQRGDHLQPTWVAHSVCQSHRDGLQDNEEDVHVAFWIHTGYQATRKVSTECINDRHVADDRRGRQPLLPYDGFEREYLQNYYVFKGADGVEIGVPTREATDDQLAEKADFHKGLARQALAHAVEIERYIEWRRGATASRVTA